MKNFILQTLDKFLLLLLKKKKKKKLDSNTRTFK